eukprot:GHVQ01043560.1.p1 GENE.GHVQ01043560.1~~GHVQ01043560.1.p1  ORF type:complete len:119 (+),score=1.99 GHVQ01043560.1:97-453(+)
MCRRCTSHPGSCDSLCHWREGESCGCNLCHSLGTMVCFSGISVQPTNGTGKLPDVLHQSNDKPLFSFAPKIFHHGRNPMANRCYDYRCMMKESRLRNEDCQKSNSHPLLQKVFHKRIK